MLHRVNLEKDDIERIKKYRYATNGLTIVERTIYEPYWNFVANHCLPDWMAPNLITLSGLIFPILALIVILVMSPGFTEVLPPWVFVFIVFSTFWF
jgi:hypothetical protein